MQQEIEMAIRWKAMLTCTMTLLSALAVTAAPAAAHECESYNGSECDPDECKDGENHKHTHLKYWWEPGEDESCASTKSGEPPCRVLNQDVPQILCDLSGDVDSQPSLP